MTESKETAYVLVKYRDATGTKEVGDRVNMPSDWVARLVTVGIVSREAPASVDKPVDKPAQTDKPAAEPVDEPSETVNVMPEAPKEQTEGVKAESTEESATRKRES